MTEVDIAQLQIIQKKHEEEHKVKWEAICKSLEMEMELWIAAQPITKENSDLEKELAETEKSLNTIKKKLQRTVETKSVSLKNESF